MNINEIICISFSSFVYSLGMGKVIDLLTGIKVLVTWPWLHIRGLNLLPIYLRSIIFWN